MKTAIEKIKEKEARESESFNIEHELNKVHQFYQAYRKSMQNSDVNHQNALANLYSVYIKRELKALWYSDITNPKATEELNDYLINWYQLIKRFKNSIK